LGQLDPAFTNVLEFRHPSWWNEDVYRKLTDRNVSFCGMSHPDLPAEVIINAPDVYYRFHGVPDLYRSSYTDQKLRKIVNQVKGHQQVRAVWFYFNNDSAVAAIPNARATLAMATG
jgi:uncharacterized protein YecE (DUF72 family)